MTDNFGAEDYLCENDELGVECDYPFCSCEEEDIFYDPFRVDDFDLEDIEVESEEYE